MEKAEGLVDFYKRKLIRVPDSIHNEMGHFDLFKLDPYVGSNARPIPYKRRDYYKIMLVEGPGKVHYADKVIQVQKQGLSFSNPQIPYKWEHTEDIKSGFFCVFNKHFFDQFGNLDQYPVFHPTGNHIFELSDKQVEKVKGLFERMFREIGSDYVHKYDVLRNIVFDLLHFAMKMQPSSEMEKPDINAAQRISILFIDLLERQFPIVGDHQQLKLKSASDFADQLNVHVNHLNRAIKETTQKTTTQIITERILKESKILLKHSNRNVSEIAYALDFKEVTHFSNFFKKHIHLSPTQFRNT